MENWLATAEHEQLRASETEGHIVDCERNELYVDFGWYGAGGDSAEGDEIEPDGPEVAFAAWR